MKYLKILPFCIILLYACSQDLSESNVHIFLDITDASLHEHINSSVIHKDISGILNLDTDFAGAATVYIHDMDDLSRSRPKTVELPFDEKGNSMVRKTQIVSFEEELKGAISDKIKAVDGKDHSKLLEKICGVFENEQSVNTSAIVYSDLLQHSSWVSFYNSEELDEASEHPLKFARNTFDSKCEASLENIPFYIFSLRNSNTDSKVSKAESFWRKWLTSRGASVEIKS